MTFLKHISPLRAYRDLRQFLARRRRHELWFMAASLAVTLTVIYAFVLDSNVAVPYKKNIIYVDSWPITRSEADIRAQQRVDEARRKQEQAVIEAKQKERQAEFKKYDDWLKKHGI